MKLNIRKNMMKVLTIGLTSAILLTGCGEEPFAKVNGETISKEEYQKYLDFTYANVEARFGEGILDKEMAPGKKGKDLIKDQLKEELPRREAILQYAKKNKIEVKDADLNKEFEKIKKSFKDKEFEEFLKSAKIDEKGFKEILKVDMITDALRKKLMKENKPSEEEIKKYYEENKESFDTVTASHILVESEEEAKEISEAIKGGANFEDFIDKSIDEASKAAKGSVGEFPRHGKMVEEFSEAAFAMEPGQVSDPIKSEFGYHIIRLDGKKTGLDAVKKDIEQSIESEKAMEEMEKIAEDAKIEVLMKEDKKEEKKEDKKEDHKEDNKAAKKDDKTEDKKEDKK
ncbi:MAG: peptidyl-prolyl cis-trans isomerase [Andreesenia angusta]|nr:peptidyl-prolyl cis-trans isomerase [Andreesenia angusta]